MDGKSELKFVGDITSFSQVNQARINVNDLKGDTEPKIKKANNNITEGTSSNHSRYLIVSLIGGEECSTRERDVGCCLWDEFFMFKLTFCFLRDSN